MSLTRTHEVYAAVHEDGINDLITAFYDARRRYFVYGTPIFFPSTTAAATSVPPINFPGVPSGIQYAIGFFPPRVDLHPDSSGGASPLPPQPNQFSVGAKVVLAVLCGGRDRPNDDIKGGRFATEFVELEIHARGSVVNDATGIGFRAEQIEIVDITPENLESALECVLLMILNATLENVRIPLDTVSIGAFSLTLADGPRIEDDQVKVWGTI